MEHPAVSCFVKLPVNLSGICALCQKYRIPPLFWKFFQKRACNFSVIVLLLYPTKAGCWIHSVPPPLFFFLFLPSYYCYFLHLPSYHLPCLPERAKKRWPTCTGPSLFFLSFILRSAEQMPAGRRRRSRESPAHTPGRHRPAPPRGRLLPGCPPLPQPFRPGRGCALPASQRA